MKARARNRESVSTPPAYTTKCTWGASFPQAPNDRHRASENVALLVRGIRVFSRLPLQARPFPRDPKTLKEDKGGSEWNRDVPLIEADYYHHPRFDRCQRPADRTSFTSLYCT